MVFTVILLGASIFIIYISCELFVNAIEWIGVKYALSKSAVGTILAAFGTALPESVVTLVAVLFSETPEQQGIGIGASLGGPLVLGTLAYAFTGIAILWHANSCQEPPLSEKVLSKLSRDQFWFVCLFICKIGLGLFAFSYKPLFGLFFLLAYVLYVMKELTNDTGDHSKEENLSPLFLDSKKATPTTARILLQTGLALTFIFLSSHFFVLTLETLSIYFGLSPILMALLLSPVATELPEMINAFIWIRQGKQQLALSNISGSMMIQTTVPTSFGIFFTPWIFNEQLIWSGLITLLSVVYLYMTLVTHRYSPQKLAFTGLFYLLFMTHFLLHSV